MAAEYKGAPRETLEELHRLLTDALLTEFEQGNRTAAFLNAVRGFLKDNHCHVNMASAADLRRSLADLRSLGLPFVNPTKKESEK